MLHRRAGRPQRGVRRIEGLDGPANELLTRMVPTHEADSVRDALSAAIDAYLELRNDEPPRERINDMPGALRRYLDMDRPMN